MESLIFVTIRLIYLLQRLLSFQFGLEDVRVLRQLRPELHHCHHVVYIFTCQLHKQEWNYQVETSSSLMFYHWFDLFKSDLIIRWRIITFYKIKIFRIHLLTIALTYQNCKWSIVLQYYAFILPQFIPALIFQVLECCSF